MRIYKYELRAHETSIDLPRGAKALSVIAQNNKIVMYATVDERSTIPTAAYDYVILATGCAEVPAFGFGFLGTVDAYQDGSLILHVFVDTELLNEKS